MWNKISYQSYYAMVLAKTLQNHNLFYSHKNAKSDELKIKI